MHFMKINTRLLKNRSNDCEVPMSKYSGSSQEVLGVFVGTEITIIASYLLDVMKNLRPSRLFIQVKASPQTFQFKVESRQPFP